jgi:hypothetical protein
MAIDWAAWARAANPLQPATTEAQAVRAARMGAVSAALMVVQSLAGAPFTLRFTEQIVAAVGRTVAAPSGDAEADALSAQLMEQMAALMPPLVIGVAVASALIMAVLAAVQWKRPNPIIPGVLLGLTAYGLLNLPLSFMHPMSRQMLSELDVPAVYWVYAVASYLVHGVLQTAGFRGGLKLNRLRDRT